MFETNIRANKASQVIATLLATALVLWAVGVNQYAQAASLVDVSDTLTDSGPSEVSGHTIEFTVPTGSTLAAANNITITFPASFGLVSTVIGGDITVEVDGTPDAIVFGSASATNIVFSGVDATAGQVVKITIQPKITNPATVQSYEIEVALANATSDVGKTRVAIVDTVLVEAEVLTSFIFTVSGMASTSGPVNGETLNIDTSTTSIDFGVLTAGVPKVGGQRLRVTTNAREGFVVTVQQDGELESANGAIIDSFIEGAYTNTPTAWTALSNDINDDTTWGHWGLTSSDADLNGDEFGTQLFVAASTTPRVIFSHDDPANGVEPNIGLVDVAYKIEVTPLQEAADDYNTTLMYIATPVF